MNRFMDDNYMNQYDYLSNETAFFIMRDNKQMIFYQSFYHLIDFIHSIMEN